MHICTFATSWTEDGVATLPKRRPTIVGYKTRVIRANITLERVARSNLAPLGTDERHRPGTVWRVACIERIRRSPLVVLTLALAVEDNYWSYSLRQWYYGTIKILENLTPESLAAPEGLRQLHNGCSIRERHSPGGAYLSCLLVYSISSTFPRAKPVANVGFLRSERRDLH